MIQIEKLQIYGFGKWVNANFNFHQNLTILDGPNESGKTSLKQCILYILFDSPSSVKKQYEPKEGSRFGGRLFLQVEQIGQVIIERVNDKQKGKASCYLPDGSVQDEAFLKQLLKGMDRHTFENIFAFDDQELQRLQSIKADELGKVLFGIGLSGSNRITEVEHSLDKELEKWYKKKGKKPIINAQLQKIKQLKEKLSQLEEKEDEYNELVEKKNTLLHQLEQMKKEWQELENEDQLVQKFLQSKEAIQQVRQLEAKLEQYPEEDSFPEQGLLRLEKIHEVLLPLESEGEGLANQEKLYQDKLEELRRNLLHDEAFQSLKKINTLHQEFLYLERKRTDVEGEYKEKQGIYEKEINSLGVQSYENTFNNYTLSIFVEEKWKELVKNVEKLEAEIQGITREYSIFQQEKQETEDLLNKEQEQLLPNDKVQQLQKQLQEHEKNEWLKESMKNQDNITRTFKKAGQVSLMIGLFTLLVFSVLGYMQQTSIFYWIGGGIFLFTFIIFSLLKQSSGNLTKKLHQQQKIHLSDEQTKTYKEMLSKHEQIKSNVLEWRRKLDDIERKITILKDRQNEIKREQLGLDEQIEMEIEKYPFLRETEVQYWPAFFHKLSNLQSAEQQLEELNSQLLDIERKQQELKEQVDNHARLCKVSLQGDVWNQLKTLYDQEEKKRQEINQLQGLIQSLKEQQQILHSKQKTLIEEKTKLFQTGKVSNEEDFLRKGKLIEEKGKLMEQLGHWRQQIQFIFHTNSKAIVQEQIDWDEMELKKQDIVERKELLKEREEELRQEAANCHASLQQLEDNKQISEVRHQLAFLYNELKNQLQQWMRFKAASMYLTSTKEKYQNEYLPAILERASYFFERLTNGEYIRFIPPKDEHNIQVENKDQYIFDIAQLSTGTVAQAYVALRIALSEMMNATFKIPFLIDDAFVHFDGIRKQEMFAILEELSQRQQVLYFTCFESNFTRNTEMVKINLKNMSFLTS